MKARITKVERVRAKGYYNIHFTLNKFKGIVKLSGAFDITSLPSCIKDTYKTHLRNKEHARRHKEKEKAFMTLEGRLIDVGNL